MLTEEFPDVLEDVAYWEVGRLRNNHNGPTSPAHTEKARTATPPAGRAAAVPSTTVDFDKMGVAASDVDSAKQDKGKNMQDDLRTEDQRLQDGD
jgi:hypothetical protein